MAQETITAAVTQATEICNAFTVAYVASHGGSIAGAFQGPLVSRPLADASNVGFLYNATDQTPPLVYQCLPISAFGYAWYLVAAGADENDIRTVLGITPGIELSVTTPAALGVAAVGVGTTAARDDHVHQMPTAVQVGAIATSALSNASPAAPGTPSAGVSTNVSRADHVHTPTTAAQVGLGVVTATGADAATARAAIGLGSSATANTGTGPTNVIVGNDTRLTNARVPTAHAASHASGGSDPIAPSDIGAIAASVMTTNGDIITRIAGVPARVAATSDGYVLTLATGLPTWAPASGGFTDPLTTNGDIIARIAGVTTRLPKGSSLQVLRVNLAGTALEYAAATPMTSNGDLVTYDSGQPKRLGLGSAGTVLSVSGGAPSWIAPTVTAAQISDATAAGRTLLTAADASAQLTALGALATSLLTTRGDIYVRNVASVNRLPLGATNDVFSSDGTDAKWQTVATVMEGISSTRGSILRRGASGWEAVTGAEAADTFLGGDGTDLAVRTAAQVRTSLRVAPPYVMPTGLGANDVLVIVPDSATEGGTTFTDLALGRTLTPTAAYHSTLRRAFTRSCMKLGAAAIGGSNGYVTAAQSNDFNFATGDFTIQVCATVLTPVGVTQRLISQGRLEDGDKRWAFGLSVVGKLNFAYSASGIVDRDSVSSLQALCLGRPVLYEVGRSGTTLKMFVDGAVVYSGTDSAALGVPVSGSPASADALIVGARNPSSPTEPAPGLEIHYVRVVKGACLHTAAYDPTT